MNTPAPERHEVVVVVPCFNEQQRLRFDGFEALLREPGVGILFVDDGSSDATPALLAAWVEAHPQAALHALERNAGKGEAVRRGMLHALTAGADVVGYLDADLSTPAEEMARMVALMRANRAEALLGSRVLLLGRDIVRRPLRHYLGRVFATGASLALALPVYDTQCGAKLFRRSGALEAALATPFSSRWAFDVEFLGRLLAPPAGVTPVPVTGLVEVPLRRWRDVGGSKLSLAAMAGAGVDLLRLHHTLRRHRRRPTA